MKKTVSSLGGCFIYLPFIIKALHICSVLRSVWIVRIVRYQSLQ